MAQQQQNNQSSNLGTKTGQTGVNRPLQDKEQIKPTPARDREDKQFSEYSE